MDAAPDREQQRQYLQINVFSAAANSTHPWRRYVLLFAYFLIEQNMFVCVIIIHINNILKWSTTVSAWMASSGSTQMNCSITARYRVTEGFCEIERCQTPEASIN